jgi:hypothetical protein
MTVVGIHRIDAGHDAAACEVRPQKSAACWRSVRPTWRWSSTNSPPEVIGRSDTGGSQISSIVRACRRAAAANNFSNSSRSAFRADSALQRASPSGRSWGQAAIALDLNQEFEQF